MKPMGIESSADPATNPNLLFDRLNEKLKGRYCCHSILRTWYRVENANPKLLTFISDEEFHREFWPVYDAVARDMHHKVSAARFKDAVDVLGRMNGTSLWVPKSQEVALKDGQILDLKKGELVGHLKEPTDYFLPISFKDWKDPQPCPIWEEFLLNHTHENDKQLLKAFLGYIFSGCNVSEQQSMLIIIGPTDSGKSQILNFLLRALPEHTTKLSVTNCLQSPVAAANILGKRIVVSSEATIRARDGARFRSLVSGEEVYVKRLFKSESVIAHNAVFVSVMNEIGYLEDVPENRKRIRVVEWFGQIPEEKMDFTFIDKLLSEKAGFMVQCLKEFLPFITKRFPSGPSTEKFMVGAGANFNQIKAWFQENEICGGEIFVSTDDLFEWFKTDTGIRRFDKIGFGRQVTKILGTDFQKRIFRNGRDYRGFGLNRTLNPFHGFASSPSYVAPIRNEAPELNISWDDIGASNER